MPVEMKTYAVSDIAEILSGGTPKTSISEYWNGDIPWLSVKDFNNDSLYVYKTERKITQKGLNNCSATLLKKDDIVISARGTVGVLTMVPFPMTFNQSCFGLRAKSDFVNATYLYYALQTKVKEMILNSHGSVFNTINRDDFDNIKIQIPSLKKQIKIGCILSDFDKRIENLRAQNRVLEQTAKTIYDYTFLQCAGHQTTYNKTLNRNIPINWEVCSIGDYVKDTKGGDWGKEEPKKNYNLQVSCIRGADIDKMTNLPIRYILAKNTSKLLQEFDLVVEISGGSPTQSTGRSRLITKELLEKFDNKLICSNFCQAVTMKNPLYAYYFCFMWKMFYDNGTFFNFEGKTSGIKNFQLDQFLDTMWFFPDLQTVKNFNAQVSPLIQKQLLNAKQIETLTTQRNTLLPLLMTSQIEV